MEPIKIMRTIIMRTTEKQIIGNQYDIEKNATTNSVSENSSKSEKNITKSNNNLTKSVNNRKKDSKCSGSNNNDFKDRSMEKKRNFDFNKKMIRKKRTTIAFIEGYKHYRKKPEKQVKLKRCIRHTTY